MSIRISIRLQAIAEQVPYGARVIDVGTDHAMIPVWLAQTGRASHVWASDICPGPLRNAADLIRETEVGDRVETRLTDGLTDFGPDDGDTVIIAGMGGETMVSILSPVSWTRNDTLLILSPHTKQDILRGYLLENGFIIIEESLVSDSGKIYPILTVRGGRDPHVYSAGELYTGALHRISQNALFPAYLDVLIQRVEKAAPYDASARALMEEFKSMKERIQNDTDGT